MELHVHTLVKTIINFILPSIKFLTPSDFLKLCTWSVLVSFKNLVMFWVNSEAGMFFHSSCHLLKEYLFHVCCAWKLLLTVNFNQELSFNIYS